MEQATTYNDSIIEQQVTLLLLTVKSKIKIIQTKCKSLSLPSGVVVEGVGVVVVGSVGDGRDPTLHSLILQHSVTQD